MPNDGHTPAGWTSVDKVAAVVETAALNEMEPAAYSRQRGLYPAQLQGRRQACEQANDWDRSQARRLHETRQADQQQIKPLARELRQKETALAKTAALLVLRKKGIIQNLWFWPDNLTRCIGNPSWGLPVNASRACPQLSCPRAVRCGRVSPRQARPLRLGSGQAFCFGKRAQNQ